MTIVISIPIEIVGLIFVSIIIVVILIFKYHRPGLIRNVFYERIIELEKITPKKGIEGDFSRYYVNRNNLVNPAYRHWLLDSTVILGRDSHWRKGPGEGIWTFLIDYKILKYLKSITLKISSIRTHEGLHTPAVYTQHNLVGEGSVYINDNPIDKNIKLERRMPKGRDLGMHEVGPYPIINWIDIYTQRYQIKLTVNDYAVWGVDEIALEPVVERWRIRPIWHLLLGAVLSVLAGLFFI
jgi:hypothetical protein